MLKSSEKRTMPTTVSGRPGARGVRAMIRALRGMAASMNGRRRPNGVQMRSLQAPTRGWTTAPSTDRVLLSKLTSSTLVLGMSSGSTALLKA